MDALLDRIVQFCKGDKAKAKRLVNEAMQNHPGQPAVWYLQKVIGDLEREQAEYFQRRRAGHSSVNPTHPNPPEIIRPKPPSSPVPPAVTPGKTLRQDLAQSRKAKPRENLVNSKQMRYLLNLLQNNTSTANRLIESTRSRYPGRSDQWVLEKVIHDLERDRR